MKLLEKAKRTLDNVSKLKSKRVLIVGDVGVDEYVVGQVRRISPEAPVPVVEVAEETRKLGLSTNVAQNVASLGGEAVLVSVVGTDPHAEALRRLLASSNVSPKYLVEDDSRPTTRKLRVMAGHHHIVRVDFEDRKFLDTKIQGQLLDQVEKVVPQVDGVILQDYSKGVLSESCIQSVIAAAKRHNKPVAVDPHRSTPLNYYRGADLMTPNFDEALALTGHSPEAYRGISESLAEIGGALMKGIGSKQMVITRGKDGMSLFENGMNQQIPTFARQVFDVTGAGDTVIAALTLAWVAGLSLEDSCVLANFAAGVVVGKVGCVPCATGELMDFVQGLIASGAFTG